MALSISYQTAAQRCLRISEIQYNIFEKVAEGNTRSGLQTLARMARTSKFFRESALDVLWKHQASLAPLFKCLPDDLLEERSLAGLTDIHEMRFRRAIRDGDLDRFVFYAQRIRALTPYFLTHACRIGFPFISTRTLKKLIDFAQAPLLPNIRSLRVAVCDFEHMPSLFGHNLTTLHFSAVRVSKEKLVAVLRHISDTCPRIKDLDIACSSRVGRVVNRFPPKLKRLHTLRLSGYHVRKRTLIRIASLVELEVACFALTRGSVESFPSSFLGLQSGFPRLKCLSIAFDNLDTCLKFLSLTRFVAVERLEFTFEEPFPSWKIRRLLVAIVAQFSHNSLKELHLSLSRTDAYNEEDLGDYCSAPKHVLRPLFVFSKLHTLTFATHDCSAFDEECYDELYQAWPHPIDLVWGFVR